MTQTELNFWLRPSARQHRNPNDLGAYLCTRIWVSAMIGLLKKPWSICQSAWREIQNAFPVIRWVRLGGGGGGVGGHLLSDLVGCVMLIRVWSLGSWVLQQSIQLHHLHLASWTGCLFGLEGSVKRWWPVFICGAKYFFLQKKINAMISFWKKKT